MGVGGWGHRIAISLQLSWDWNCDLAVWGSGWCESSHFSSQTGVRWPPSSQPSGVITVCKNSNVVFSPLFPGSDNLARFGGLEDLVNNEADDTWDNKAAHRISAIHFLDADEDDDDEKVRVALSTFPSYSSCWIFAERLSSVHLPVTRLKIQEVPEKIATLGCVYVVLYFFHFRYVMIYKLLNKES